MKASNLIIAWAAIAVLLSTPSMAEEKRIIRVETAVYQVISGDITGVTSRTDDVYQGIDSPTLEEKKHFRVWTLSNIKDEPGVMLKADQQDWKWDGKDVPENEDKVKRLAWPAIATFINETAKLAVCEEIPVFYFKKRPDGLFEMTHKYIEVGLFVSITPEEGKGGRIVLRDLEFTFTSIGEREPIEDVPLEVGAPIAAKKSYTTSLAVKPGMLYGMTLYTESQGTYVIQLRASELTAEELAEEKEKREKAKARVQKRRANNK